MSGLYPVECRIGIIVRIGRCFATDGAGQCDLQSKRIVNLFATITPDIVLARDAADRARIDVGMLSMLLRDFVVNAGCDLVERAALNGDFC